jgi:chemotaxis protein histidine kinase CheA
MSSNDAPALPPDVLRALQERYRGTVASTLELLREMARELSAVPAAPQTLDALRRELHRVHGTAGSYGYDLASRVASTLEACVIRWSVDPLLDRDERGAVVDRFVAELEAAFQRNEPVESPPAR